MGCHAFLQGNRPNPGIEPVSLTSPALAGGFFTTGATWEAPLTPENLPVLEMGVTRVVFRWDRVWVISSVCGVYWGAVAVLCAVGRAAGLGGVAPAPGVPVAAHVASLSGSFSWSAPCPCGCGGWDGALYPHLPAGMGVGELWGFASFAGFLPTMAWWTDT